MPISILNPQELRRYRHQIAMQAVGIAGQEKLKKAKVAIVGIGAIGTPVLQYLVAAGVGKIGIIDYDKVEEQNIHRQILFNTQDIGKHKTVVAAKKLSDLNNLIEISIHNVKLEDKDIHHQILSGYDMIIDAGNSLSTHYLLSDFCATENKALVYGAVYFDGGEVSTLILNGAPSYRCIYPEEPFSQKEFKGNFPGILGTVGGIVGSLMAHEAFKVITGSGELLCGKLLQINASQMTFETKIVERNPDNF